MPRDVTLTRLTRSWQLSLEAQNKSVRTVDTYTDSLRFFVRWLAEAGHTDVLATIKRSHVEGYIASELERNSASTASVRYRSLRVFFAWCVDEEEIDRSPMERMSPPIIPEEPVAILTDDELRRLLKVTGGKSFVDRRDHAIVRLLFDTGVRRAEIAGLSIADVDLDHRMIIVLGKGRRPRAVPFGAASARSLDRYLRVRDDHRLAETPKVWLGAAGRTFSDVGLRQMLERRGAQAGVTNVHAHRFRHSFANAHLADGGNETDLMMLTGWKSRAMLNRYGASVAAARAKANYRSPGDRLG